MWLFTRTRGTSRAAARKPARRSSQLYLAEKLEARRLLAVIFSKPANITTTDGGGPVIFHPHVELILWGSGWNTNPTPSQAQITAMVSSITSGPFLNDLTAYRAGMGSGFLSATVVDTTSSPPAGNCPQATLDNYVLNLINNGTVPRPSTDPNLYYMVIPQPGTTGYTVGTIIAGGYHTSNTDNKGTVFHYGCTVNDGHMDTISTAYSHELAEAVSDPEGNTIRATVGGDNEICDGICQGFGARLNGYQVNAYWLDSKKAILVPDGVQDIQFNGGNVQVTGDQLFGQDDVVSLGIDPAHGGDVLTFNGESVEFLNGTQNNTPLSFTINAGAGNDTVNIGQVQTSIPIFLDAGTSNNDTLNVTCGVGNTSVSGSSVNGPGQHLAEFVGFDNVNVTGSSGNDTLTVTGVGGLNGTVIDGGGGNDNVVMNCVGAGKTTLRGGAGDDFIDVLGTTDFGAGTVTVDGGAGSNELGVDPQTSGDPFSFNVNTGLIDATDVNFSPGSSVINYSNIQSLEVTGQTKNDTFFINSTPGPALIRGGLGDDTFNIGNFLFAASTIANLTMDGQGGNDTLALDDETRTVGGTYLVGVNSAGVSNTIASGPAFSYDYGNFENVSLTTGSGADNVTIGGASTVAVTVNTGGGNDSVTLPALRTSNVTVAGGGGTDQLLMNDAGMPLPPFEADIFPDEIERHSTPFGVYNGDGKTFFGSFENVIYDANPAAVVLAVFGTASDVTGQTTVQLGTHDDTIEVFPHDAAGKLTINSNIGILGGAGSNSLIVNDQGSAAATHYVLSNPFGAGTQDIGGMGTGLLGVTSDVQSIAIDGGSGDDVFDVNSFKTGASLLLNGGAGNDTANVTPSTGNLSGNVTSIAALSFDGGDGFDTFTLSDVNSAAPWTFTRGATTLRADTTAYHLTMSDSDTEEVVISGGTQSNQFLAQVTPAGSVTLLLGGSGSNSYLIGNAQSTQSIAGAVEVVAAGAGDLVTVDDSADTTGRTFHVADGAMGYLPGDDLFGGGLLTFSNDPQLVVDCGSGADAVYATPAAASVVTINGNDPATSPGDSLTLALAGQPDASVVPTSPTDGHVDIGGVTYLNYTGFESGAIVDQAVPQVVSAVFNGGDVSQSFVVQFSEPLLFDPGASSLQLLNQSTGVTYDTSSFSETYDAASSTSTFSFVPGALKAGIYQATLPAGAFVDVAGTPLAADYVYSFLWVPAGGVLALAPSSGMVQVQQIAIGTGGTFDLSNNSLALSPAGNPPLDTIRGLIASAYDKGHWDGSGITSGAAATHPHTGIGYVDGDGTNGAPVGSLLLAYALQGDTTLKGTVGLSDYNTLAGHFNKAGTWAQGDFDYDGTVGLSDYNVLAANFNKSIAVVGAVAPAVTRTAASPAQTIKSASVIATATAPVRVVVAPTPTSVMAVAATPPSQSGSTTGQAASPSPAQIAAWHVRYEARRSHATTRLPTGRPKPQAPFSITPIHAAVRLIRF